MSCLVATFFVCMIATPICCLSDNNGSGNNVDGQRQSSNVDAITFLGQFGYIPKDKTKHGIFSNIPSADDVTTAISRFQSIVGLPVTGKIDDATAQAMSQPRCGVSDEGMLAKMMANSKAKKTTTEQMPMTPSTTHSQQQQHLPFGNYIIAPEEGWVAVNELVYRINKTSAPANIQAFLESDFENITSQWGNASGLKIRPAKGNEDAKLNIKWAKREHGDGLPFDGTGGVLGHAFFPNTQFAGEIHFDGDENWNNTPGRNLVSVMHVALHEFGHSLGLEHSLNNSAVMYPYFAAFAAKRPAVLTDDDKIGVKTIYGSGGDANNQFQTGTLTTRRIMPRVITTTTKTTRRTMTTSRPTTTTTLPDTDRRSCGYLIKHPLNAITYLSTNANVAFFTVDNYFYRIERQSSQYQPRPLASALPATPQNNRRISAMLSVEGENQDYIALFIFQDNLFWRNDFYQNKSNKTAKSTVLDEFFILGAAGSPMTISAGFAGINVSNPVVFRLANDRDTIYFLTSTLYWTYNLITGGTNSAPLSTHPVLAALPVRPPQLVAGVLSDGKNYFFAANGTFWQWLPPGYIDGTIRDNNDRIIWNHDYAESNLDIDSETTTTSQAPDEDLPSDGSWGPALSTANWLLNCKS